MEILDTHKFLFTLNYEKRIKGHEVEFLDRENKIHKIKLNKIEITASPVSCKLYDENDKRHLVPFIRIKRIYFQGKLVWDNSDADTSNVKIIKGYD